MQQVMEQIQQRIFMAQNSKKAMAIKGGNHWNLV